MGVIFGVPYLNLAPPNPNLAFQRCLFAQTAPVVWVPKFGTLPQLPSNYQFSISN